VHFDGGIITLGTEGIFLPLLLYTPACFNTFQITTGADPGGGGQLWGLKPPFILLGNTVYAEDYNELWY